MSEPDADRLPTTPEANQAPALEITFSGALVGLSGLIPNATGRQVAGILAPLAGYGLAKLVRLFAAGWASEWQAESTLRRAKRYLRELEQKAAQCKPDSPERGQFELRIRELRESIQQQRMRRLGVVQPGEETQPGRGESDPPHTN